VLITIFSDKLKWFPSGGWGRFSDMVLPAVALALMPLAYIARLTRAAMIDVLSADYVRTARAKGLGRGTVIWRHCFRNAFLPVHKTRGVSTEGHEGWRPSAQPESLRYPRLRPAELHYHLTDACGVGFRLDPVVVGPQLQRVPAQRGIGHRAEHHDGERFGLRI